MCTLLYVLGSGILDNPNVVPSCILLFLACTLAWMACKVLDRGVEGRDYQVYLLSVFCIACILSCFFLLFEGAESQHMNESHDENTEFENHADSLFMDGVVMQEPTREFGRSIWKLSQ